MAIGKTNTGGGQKTYISYAESQNTTEAQKGIALGNAGAIRVYGSVAELGLSTGTATVSTVWDAMAEGSIAILQSTELAQAENPIGDYSLAGVFQFYKPHFSESNPEESGAVFYSIKTQKYVYKMIISSASSTPPNTPTGTWKCMNDVKVSFSSFSALPQTKNDVHITSTMVVSYAYLSNPLAQASNWTVSTSSGSVTVSGTINGSTTMDLILTEE